MTSLQQFCEFLTLHLSELHQFYAPDFCPTVSWTINLIDEMWLLGTFCNFPPDQIEFFLTASASYSLPITHHNTYNLLLYLVLTTGYPTYLPSKKKRSPRNPLNGLLICSDQTSKLCFLSTSFCGLFTFLFPLSWVLVCRLPLPLSGLGPSD
jgi:hypothetical protein